MSSLKKKSRSFLLRCLTGCHNLVMLGLILSFMILLAALGLSIFYEEIPIPARVIERINQELEREGLNLEFEKVTLDFKGDLLVQNVALSFVRSEEPALLADLVYVDVNYPALILQGIPIDKINVSNATLFCPAMVSLSGTTDRLVENIHLALNHRWRQWKMPFLTGNFRNLQLSASGDLTGLITRLVEPREKGPEKPDLYLEYLKLSRQAIEASKTLNALHAPHVELEFETPAKQQFRVSTQLTATRFSKESLLAAEKLVHTGSFQLVPDIRILSPIRFGAQNVTIGDSKIGIKNLSLSALRNAPIEDMESLFPLRFEATTSTIRYQDNQIDNLVFTGSLLDREKLEATIRAKMLQGVLTYRLQADIKALEAKGSVSGHLNLEEIVARPEFDRLWKLRSSKQHQPLYLDLNYNYPGNIDGATARFRVETRDVEVIKTPFQWARLRGEMEGTRVNLHHLEAGGHGNDLQCAFRQDLRQKFFRFTVAGRFRPHDLNLWWRDWWKQTFDYLKINHQPPFIDLAIRNAFGYKKQLTLHGYAEGENIELSGMRFDRVSSKMFIRPNYIDAYELEAHRPEGSASGQFQRELVDRELQYVLVEVTSNLDLEESLGLFGEEGRKILEPYDWEGNPTLMVQGEFNFAKEKNWHDLDIQLLTDSPMAFYQFPLDSLQVKCRYTQGNVYLDDAKFGFAQGLGIGSASFIRQEDNAFMIYDFEVTGAHLGQAIKKVSQFRNGNPAPNPDRDREEKAYKGTLDLHVSGISPAGYGLERVFAQGDVDIREGALAEIPLFGPLSELIPFSKPKLNDASMFFQWDAGKIFFPDLVLTGKTTRLEGEGVYHPDDSSLDFQVRLFLLREAGIPIVSNVIMPILDPLSYIAAVNLTGTLTEPKWQFALSPLNLFNAKEDRQEQPIEPSILEYDFRR